MNNQQSYQRHWIYIHFTLLAYCMSVSTACLLYCTYIPKIPAHISKINTKCNFNLSWYCNICNSNKYAAQMPYAQITQCALNEGSMLIYMQYMNSLINHMVSSPVHRRQWWQHWPWWWCNPTGFVELAILSKTLACMTVYRHRQIKICNSIGCDLVKPHQPIIQNYPCQDHHTLLRWNYPKLVLSRLPQPSELNIDKSQSLQDCLHSHCKKYLKSVLSRHHTPSKSKIYQNMCFQDHHILHMKIRQKSDKTTSLFKMSPFQTTIPFQSRNCPKFKTPDPSKCIIIQNYSFHEHHILPK